MLAKKTSTIFQDHMPGNICFGCGKNTKNGLHIKSYWNGKDAECILAIAQGQYQDINVVDKEINFMSTIVKLLRIIR